MYDVPLIYETNTEKRYDIILLAYCDKALQRKRVLIRDKISSSLFKKILKTQLSFEEKIKFKPRVINTNSVKLFTLIKIILLLIKTIIKLKLENGKQKVNT